VRIAILVAVLAGALAIPVGLLFARGDGGADFRGSQAPEGMTLPDFSLRDDQGRRVRSADLDGKALAVTFLDTACTESCPVIAAQIAQAVKTLGGDRRGVEALAISVDPVRDTPSHIQRFLQRYRATGALRYLHGSEAELRPVWRAFSVLSAQDSGSPNMHSAPIRIYDPDGRWRSTLSAGVDLTPANLAHDLREASS
jgi:protein SCO1